MASYRSPVGERYPFLVLWCARDLVQWFFEMASPGFSQLSLRRFRLDTWRTWFSLAEWFWGQSRGRSRSIGIRLVPQNRF